ncbi:hypothetical protein Aca07nite_31640 [Actinoplanes capillaceus]|uniref:Flavin reductase n=1 Tax=Actinoplanes campanulatus TaxID=113559 RepID=A0ABQ3WI29_9ACTN|nr:hypothetical protein Aca07nite_31640 [Actinoplanes capillaceus]
MDMPPAQEEHIPSRPTWKCLACTNPWPCAAAQSDLANEYRAFPSVLTLYLATQMYEALEDHIAQGRGAPGDLYERFLSWTRRQPPSR